MKTIQFHIVGRLRKGKIRIVVGLFGLLSLVACTAIFPQADTLSSGSLIETPSPTSTATLTLTPTATPSPTNTLTATATPLPAHAGWPLGQPLLVGKRDGAWLRQTPDSQSERIVAILPNGTDVMITADPYFDGVQWWWPLKTANGYAGWVEQTALTMTASRNWIVGQRLAINKVGDVWLRGAPSSTSDAIVAMLGNQTIVTVSGEPANDGVQWWWPVMGLPGQFGWVEQDSLVEYIVPTAAFAQRTRIPILPPVGIVNPVIIPIEAPPGVPATFPAPVPNPPPGQELPPVVQPPPPQPTMVQVTVPPPVEQPPDQVATPPGPTVEVPVTVVAGNPGHPLEIDVTRVILYPAP
jgi:hypothetical protein